MLESTDEGTWLNPIIRPLMLQETDYQWLMMPILKNEFQHPSRWISSMRGFKSGVQPLELDRRGLNAFKSDVMDIDLDVLGMLDWQIDAREMQARQQGQIPLIAKLRLNILAEACQSARTILIVTSPGYLDQQIAVHYAKYLVGRLIGLYGHGKTSKH